jgi:ergothioneine biosynthesis protein EgtB
MSTRPLFAEVPIDRQTLIDSFREVRRTTERLCKPLALDDFMLQAMPDVSPTKWHLAHVSWFFETFVLVPYWSGYQAVDDRYRYLFNSYYNGAGPQYSRPERGMLSRPTVAEVFAYRADVDRAMAALIEKAGRDSLPTISALVVLGMHHEQQHQELMLTDVKYNLWVNPLRPPYHKVSMRRGTATPRLRWLEFEGGVEWIGHGGPGFAFDNECPRHQTFLRPFRLASRLVTNGEYLEFVKAGGYGDSRPWLAEGWKLVCARRWQAPLYWEMLDGLWQVYTLAGMQPLDEHAPVAHLSYYEADAYARWAGQRLPTEQEWEHAAQTQRVCSASAYEAGVFEPLPAAGIETGPEQMTGDVWQWTRSPYVPYPGFRPWPDILGEYNGKFMVNQIVLRGGSCATPASHIRLTYRNFFPPDARWQFSGLRLAEDV